MPGDCNLSMWVDPALKSQAEEALSQWGMTITETVTMFLEQIVREQSVPLPLSFHAGNAVYADLLTAQTDRRQGCQGRDARLVLADMERAIAAADKQASRHSSS